MYPLIPLIKNVYRQYNEARDIPVELKGLDGVTHNLKDWQGKVILLNFWTSRCAPCQYEIKDLVVYQKQYGEQGLQIIGIGLDQKRRLENVKRSLGINYPVLVADASANRNLLTRWGNKKQILPYSVVITQAGQLIHRQIGIFNPTLFEKIVKPLLSVVNK